MSKRSAWLAVLCVFSGGTFASACMWDYDTLKMERYRFPKTLELITGKFLRHSDAFYRWRVEDRTQRIESNPSDVALYDDLAVAYDKLGRHEQAIEVILRKEAIQPGLYETYANLGTFHAHAGRLDEGLKHLRKAVAINPDAHFGREIYQILLIEYVLERRGENETVPLPLDEADRGSHRTSGFAKYVLDQRGVPEDENAGPELKQAIKGVQGMLRFGHYDSPVLLEALGDLLLADWNEDAKRLAARAYLKASYEADSDETQAAYRKLAERALQMQVVSRQQDDQIALATVEEAFQRELEDADAWYAEVEANERRWIEEGKDVDAEFTRVYYDAPQVAGVVDEEAAGKLLDTVPRYVRWIGLAAVVTVLLVGLWQWSSQRRRDA